MMNHTTRITDWTCDRSDRRRAACRDVRFYHVGVPQLKKSLFLLLLLLFFQKKNIKFKVALWPRLGLKPMVISVSNHGHRLEGARFLQVGVPQLRKFRKKGSYFLYPISSFFKK